LAKRPPGTALPLTARLSGGEPRFGRLPAPLVRIDSRVEVGELRVVLQAVHDAAIADFQKVAPLAILL
jgi:hypothetical protein